MAEDNQELITQVTRGFAGMADQLRERDGKVATLSEKMVGVELKLDQVKETLVKVEGEMAKAENVSLKIRVDTLEKAQAEAREKQADNAKWIRGLVASVILLLIGFLLNFIRINLK